MVIVPFCSVRVLPHPALGRVSPLPLKVAVTDRAWVMETVQFPVPEQAPLQPTNVEPLAAEAVRVTLVLLAKLALQVLPQLMPAGFEVTVPLLICPIAKKEETRPFRARIKPEHWPSTGPVGILEK